MNAQELFHGFLIFGIPIGLTGFLAVAGVFLARKSRRAARMRETAVHIQLALEDFHQRNGGYPDSLGSLADVNANQLSEWVSSDEMAQLKYSSNGQSYLLRWVVPRFGFTVTNEKKL